MAIRPNWKWLRIKMAPSGVISVKSPEAFRTISEVAVMLDVPQHVLRFWETRFAQIKPIKRAGGRRFYRPEDVDLLRGIQKLLYLDGYTIRGAQKILREKGVRYTAALGRETKNGHAAASEREAVAFVPEEHAFPAPAPMEENDLETLPQECVTQVTEPQPVGRVEAPSTTNPRRARLEAVRSDLLQLKSRLTAARRSVTT
jgi:DNA-binding transcriptional MerR regulator